MPASIVMLNEPSKLGETLRGLAPPSNRRAPMTILQDGEAQKQSTKLISPKSVDIPGRRVTRRLQPHLGNDLADRLEIGSRQGQMIRQPIETESRQQVGGRLRLRRQEFRRKQDHPPIPPLHLHLHLHLHCRNCEPGRAGAQGASPLSRGQAGSPPVGSLRPGLHKPACGRNSGTAPGFVGKSRAWSQASLRRSHLPRRIPGQAREVNVDAKSRKDRHGFFDK